MGRATSVALLLFAACSPQAGPVGSARSDVSPEHAARIKMVQQQIEGRGVHDGRVLDAMRVVPRHRFVPPSRAPHAYEDRPLPIGHRQTISQPYIVGLMTELAELQPGDTVLEVGTGSGYQAAVLAQMGVEVFSIEIVEALANEATTLLSELGYGERVHVRIGDGYLGWPEHAPFDAIIVTAAPPAVPAPLTKQLEVGGHLVIPVGQNHQQLMRLTRTERGLREKFVIPVRFVPMTGRAQRP